VLFRSTNGLAARSTTLGEGCLTWSSAPCRLRDERSSSPLERSRSRGHARFGDGVSPADVARRSAIDPNPSLVWCRCEHHPRGLVAIQPCGLQKVSPSLALSLDSDSTRGDARGPGAICLDESDGMLLAHAAEPGEAGSSATESP